eukprot:364496-Chlamydomonas_euryale.AAC.60
MRLCHNCAASVRTFLRKPTEAPRRLRSSSRGISRRAPRTRPTSPPGHAATRGCSSGETPARSTPSGSARRASLLRTIQGLSWKVFPGYRCVALGRLRLGVRIRVEFQI